MISANFQWNGDKAKTLIVNATWDGLRRMTVYFWQAVTLALNVPNSGQDVPLPWGGKQRVYPHPSKPGEAPHKITGWGQGHVKYEFDQPALISRVGLAENAKYMAYLELGVRGGKEITPKKGKVLTFWSEVAQRWIFAKRVKQGPIKPRPWLLGTLKKVQSQLQAIVGDIKVQP